MTDSAAAEQPAPAPTGRRALLGAGLVGAAIALAGSRTAAATGLSDNDRSLMHAEMQLELTARDLYDAALAAGADDTWHVVRELHESYAQLIAGVIGESANTRDDAMFDQYKDRFGADPGTAAVEVEQTLAATHIAVLEKFESVDAVRPVASIAATESRLATTLMANAGETNPEALLTNPATPIDLGAAS